jgi:hypothetical protein
LSDSKRFDAIRLRAGPAALRHLAREGLHPAHVRAVPAAAGGPKGLALLPFDRWLFGDWLREVEEKPLLVGASIGAWRMAAGAQCDPLSAIDRLEDAYIHQTYPAGASPAQVATGVAKITFALAEDWSLDPAVPLRVLVAHASHRLRGRNDTRTFAGAALANLKSRDRLGAYLKRLVFESGPVTPLDAVWPVCDAFGATTQALNEANRLMALTASGSIPVVCAPVRDITGLPRGDYWDGGLIDYHLHLPYHPLGGIVLYPHFVDHVTPGWFDKHLPWRRARGRWLENVLLVSPSPAMLRRLPEGKLPDRQDFYRYEGNDPRRFEVWRRAIGECQRMVEQFSRWADDPDLSIVGRL